MTRLQEQLSRLYRADPAAQGPGDAGHGVRALVLELAHPAGWNELSAVWQAVQAYLELPAPAIALSGRDGCQLWFSLAGAVPAERGAAFLEGLRRRYLAGIRPASVRMMPGGAQAGTREDFGVFPPAQVAPDRWSAFVSPDLAPLFGDEPWLDQPAGPDAQADLLSRLAVTPHDRFEAALARLEPAAPAPGFQAQADATSGASTDPRRFLLDVMNDPAIDMRLRIEAAKALLPHSPGPRID